jgi:hypothetical protein
MQPSISDPTDDLHKLGPATQAIYDLSPFQISGAFVNAFAYCTHLAHPFYRDSPMRFTSS